MDLTEQLRASGCVFPEHELADMREVAESDDELQRLVDARVAGAPLEHVLGHVEFGGTRVSLDPGVFVPRVRTELLVRVACERMEQIAHRPTVIDLCCGSGAIGLALARAHPNIELHASDVDPTAVANARKNLDGVGVVHLGDLWDVLPEQLAGSIDLVAANVPYVPTSVIPTLPTEAREHESLVALDGGRDGLDVARRVVAGAASWLRPGGLLLIEIDREQADPLGAAANMAGLEYRVERDPDIDAQVFVAERVSCE